MISFHVTGTATFEFPNCICPTSKIVDPHTVCTLFPSVDRYKLTGGALWYDAIVPDSQRLVIDLLKATCRNSCTALNHVEARGLTTSHDNRVLGLRAFDIPTGAAMNIQAPLVVNTAGPWCRQVATSLDREFPELFHPSIAWNLLLDRPGLSDHALAVSPPKPGGHTYFLLKWKGRLLAGTGHRPWRHGSGDNPTPTSAQIDEFLIDLNAAVPDLNVREKDILNIFCGFLPAAKPDTATLAKRPVIIDHGDAGGPQGFYSVSGVKFTTSRLVADDLLSGIFGGKTPSARDQLDLIPASPEFTALVDELSGEQPSRAKIDKALKGLAGSESASWPEDLIERRLGLIPPFRRECPIIDQQVSSWSLNKS